jgi:hypothetical protein
MRPDGGRIGTEQKIAELGIGKVGKVGLLVFH